MNGAGKILSGLAGAVYLVLLAPVIVVFFIAFSADNFIVFPPSGFSTRWFERLWGHERLMSGLRISFIVAIIVSLLSLLIGVPAAYALARGESRITSETSARDTPAAAATSSMVGCWLRRPSGARVVIAAAR